MSLLHTQPFQPDPVIHPPPAPAAKPFSPLGVDPLAALGEPPTAATSILPAQNTFEDHDKFARLENLFLEQKAEQDAREAAVAVAKSDKEIFKANTTASEMAAAVPEVETQQKYESAAEKTMGEAAARPHSPSKKEKKPIKFKDAIGRKFIFPYHICDTWEVCDDYY